MDTDKQWTTLWSTRQTQAASAACIHVAKRDAFVISKDYFGHRCPRKSRVCDAGSAAASETQDLQTTYQFIPPPHTVPTLAYGWHSCWLSGSCTRLWYNVVSNDCNNLTEVSICTHYAAVCRITRWRIPATSQALDVSRRSNINSTVMQWRFIITNQLWRKILSNLVGLCEKFHEL